MESFIYKDVNLACRNKDMNQIQYFGSYAAALSYIIYSANKKRKDKFKISGKTTLYRGLKLDEETLYDFELNSLIHLTGYTSSSKDRETAEEFAL